MENTDFPAFLTESMSPDTWDALPRYFYNNEVHAEKGSITHQVTHKYKNWENQECSVTLFGAGITNSDGDYGIVFPGVNEELVEEVLKNTAQKSAERSTAVSLSADGIRKELAHHGHWLHLSEVKTAISVLMRSCIEYKDFQIEMNFHSLNNASALDFAAIAKYGQFGRLHAPILYEPGFDRYNNTNYKNILSLFLPLSRWIYRMVVSQCFSTSKENDHGIKLSSLKDSGLLLGIDEKEVGAKVNDAFDELIKIGVITGSVVETSVDESTGQSDRLYEFKVSLVR